MKKTKIVPTILTSRELFAGRRIKSVQTKNGCVNNRELPNRHFGEIIITPE